MLTAAWALLEGWALARFEKMGRRELIVFVVLAVVFTIVGVTVVVLGLWAGVLW